MPNQCHFYWVTEPNKNDIDSASNVPPVTRFLIVVLQKVKKLMISSKRSALIAKV